MVDAAPGGELLELRGATRRFTGSYERSSFTGNDFPTTSWVADRPRVLDPGEWRLEVAGLVERPAELTLDDLDAGDELVATLDCTGGFYSRQRWRGIALERLLSQARPVETATHLRVISHTGYRWGFGLGELDACWSRPMSVARRCHTATARRCAWSHALGVAFSG